MNKILVYILFIVGTFLYFYHIDTLMPFIGDQGWFYISARDMLQTGTIPLVGIASSHPWLHQGALWTYLLALFLWIFHYAPVSGAYLGALFHIGSLYLLYKIGKTYFNERVGLIATALYATSPLIILSARMPYHTAPIPFITLLLILFLLRWIHGKQSAFPWIILCLALLYNFELATFVFTGAVFSILLFGLWKKKGWAKGIFTVKILLYSLLAFSIPMLPMLIYDTSHGFVQTLGFLAWVGYKVLVVFGYPALHPRESLDMGTMIHFVADAYKRLLFIQNGYIAASIFLTTILYCITLVRLLFKKRKVSSSILLILFLSFVALVGLFITKVPSEAYLPMLFPSVILFTAIVFAILMKHPLIKALIAIVILGICVGNVHFILRNHYSYDHIGTLFTLQKREEAVAGILRKSDGKAYTIRGAGEGSQFASFTMNYAYLAWYMGHAPSQKREKQTFIITDSKNGIVVKEIKK